MKTLAKIIALGFYSGLSPIAPGTAGTILAAMLFLFLKIFLIDTQLLLLALLVFSICVGFWSAQQYSFSVQKKDPSEVVIDEWAGYYLTYFLVLFFLKDSWILFVEIFLFFRLFDIIKPFPINISQNLAGAWGIMIDDLLAAFYACLLILLLHKLLILGSW